MSRHKTDTILKKTSAAANAPCLQPTNRSAALQWRTIRATRANETFIWEIPLKTTRGRPKYQWYQWSLQIMKYGNSKLNLKRHILGNLCIKLASKSAPLHGPSSQILAFYHIKTRLKRQIWGIFTSAMVTKVSGSPQKKGWCTSDL